MQITKLRLSGFKSFVQPTELCIEAGLTGIVGPNGCGKSNVVDALRWVMGESSAKGLRGGEMDDVIFAGTSARPAYDLAEVALHLVAEGEPIAGFEGEEDLELSRRIARGLGSVFRVNGKEVRARDIQLLFADAASGARSAAIVSQGRIGALVEAKPGERRKLLEEAAGIGGLQARRHEAELKLQAAEANLVRVADLLVTLNEQFVVLQKQARQAERYRKLATQHRETEAALLVGRYRLAQAELRIATEALSRGRGDVQLYASRLAEARQKRESASVALTEFRRHQAATATELARLGERRRGFEAEAARVGANLAQLMEQERQTVRDLDHAEKALLDARDMVDRLTGEAEGLKELVAQGSAEVESAAAAEEQASLELAAADEVFRRQLALKATIEARLQQVDERCHRSAEEQAALEAQQKELDRKLASLAGAVAVGDGDDLGDEAAEAAYAEATAMAEQTEAMLAAAEERRSVTLAALHEQQEALAEAEAHYRARDEIRRRAADEGRLLLDRVAELDARIRKVAERRGALAARTEDRAAARGELDVEHHEQRVDEIEQALAAIESALAESRGLSAEVAAEADAAAMAARGHEATLERLEAEAAALAELAGEEIQGQTMLDLVTIQEGYAEALGAALGDDLLAGPEPSAPSFWRPGPEGPDLKSGASPLPEGAVPLAEVVTAPPVLARRLRQVGLIAEHLAQDMQDHLVQGQRLVTREGGLWRWDGLVRRPDAARAAAARLRQQARRRTLESELKAAREDLGAAQAAAADAAAARNLAARAVEETEAKRDAARITRDTAKDAMTRARSKLAALVAELGPLREEEERLGAEQAELESAKALAEAQFEDLDNGQAANHAVGEAQQALDRVRGACSTAKREDEEAQAAQAQARHAAAEARRAAGTAQDQLEQRRSKARRQEAAAREQAIMRAQLEAHAARLEEDRLRLAERHGADATSRESIAHDLTAAIAASGDAESALVRARHAHGEAAARHAAIRDRHATASSRMAQLDFEMSAWTGRIRAAEERTEDLVARRRRIVSELADLDGLPKDLARQQDEVNAAFEAAEARHAGLVDEVESARLALEDAEAALERIDQEQLQARESGARLEAHLERAEANLHAAAAAVHGRLGQEVEALPGEPPTPQALAELEAQLARLEASREKLGAVNLRAIDEAAELDLRITTLQQEQDELTQAIDRLRRAISALNREGRERLKAAFNEVEGHFETLFKRLFGGGRARLELTDLEDPLNAGLELSASPPGKKLQSLSLLSGGEKALTALALIFAVFLTRPSPLCLLDEVDAPLDDANVNRMANLLAELTQETRTRFIVVTHHPLTMARMDRLYGVTMIERGVSQLVGVDLRTAVELRATA